MPDPNIVADDNCAGHNCDCDEFAPVVIGHLWHHGGPRGYSEIWTLLSPGDEEAQVVIWENGADVSCFGSLDEAFSFDNVRSMVVDDFVPGVLFDMSYTMTDHEGPVDDYEAKLAAAWTAVNDADEEATS